MKNDLIRNTPRQGLLYRLKHYIKLIILTHPLRNYRKFKKQPMIAYPQTLPLDAATLIAEIVKARQVTQRKAEFAHAGWNVQGYVQKVTLGEPIVMVGADGTALSTEAQDATFNQVADTLLGIEKELVEYEETAGMAFGAETAAEAEAESVSVMTVIAIIGAVLQAIQLWRNHNNEELLNS